MNKKIIYLKNFISDKRWNLFQKKIEERTKYITIVLEDIFQPHNISATIRSADCFGIQDVHIIENNNIFKDDSEISLGSSKWINILQYNNKKHNTKDAINKLKDKGYQIIAATPHNSDFDLFDPSLINKKTAIIFGSEKDGCSNTSIELSDKKMKIPMYGFTESFNISVAVALTLQHFIFNLRKSKINWKMNKKEREETILQWLRNSIKSSDNIEKKYIIDNS
tara:strand:- start:8191 stop:8859 length:669 start_codon:yes stop_codon:yes gene_type:complete